MFGGGRQELDGFSEYFGVEQVAFEFAVRIRTLHDCLTDQLFLVVFK